MEGGRVVFLYMMYDFVGFVVYVLLFWFIVESYEGRLLGVICVLSC